MINLGAQVSLAVEGSECQGGMSTFKSKSHLEGFELQEGPLRKLRSHMDCTREGVFRDLTATGSRKGVVSSVKQGGKLTASCSCASVGVWRRRRQRASALSPHPEGVSSQRCQEGRAPRRGPARLPACLSLL